MGRSGKRVLMLRPLPQDRTRQFTGFTVPGSRDYMPDGITWGMATTELGIFGKRWEPSDFPWESRPVFNYGGRCLYTMYFEGVKIKFSNHWEHHAIWGQPAAPNFNSDATYRSADGTYRSKYWFPGFGFDSGPNLQPCNWETSRGIKPWIHVDFCRSLRFMGSWVVPWEALPIWKET